MHKPNPATTAEAQAIRAALEQSELSKLGGVLTRLPACVQYSIHTLHPQMHHRHALNLAYVIQWLYALDAMLDSCPSLAYAQDLSLLLDTMPYLADYKMLTSLPFNHDPRQLLPGLDFSLLTLADTLQPLRYRLLTLARDPLGPARFDQYLRMVVAAMTQEASWRIAHVNPSFAEYMAAARISISGGLCLWTINALLPSPAGEWERLAAAASVADYGARLANDLGTRLRDEREGKPNAVAILAQRYDSLEQAENKVRRLISRLTIQLRQLTHFISPTLSPTTLLRHYVYRSLVVARAMYQGADFVMKGDVS